MNDVRLYVYRTRAMRKRRFIHRSNVRGHANLRVMISVLMCRQDSAAARYHYGRVDRCYVRDVQRPVGTARKSKEESAFARTAGENQACISRLRILFDENTLASHPALSASYFFRSLFFFCISPRLHNCASARVLFHLLFRFICVFRDLIAMVFQDPGEF